MSIEKLRNNKLPDEDYLQTQLFKHGGEELYRKMQQLLNEERMPVENGINLFSL